MKKNKELFNKLIEMKEIVIPIYFWQDDDSDEINIDTDSMREEFEGHLLDLDNLVSDHSLSKGGTWVSVDIESDIEDVNKKQKSQIKKERK